MSGVPRVVATGLGVVSALAVGAGPHFRRLLAGEAGIGPLDGPRRRGIPVHFEAAVPGFDPRQAIGNRMLRKLLRPSGAFAVAAASEALGDAGLPAPLAEAGLYLGSVSYDMPGRIYVPALKASFGPDGRFSFARFGEHGVPLVDPLLIVKGLPNAALCAVAIEHGIRGANANFAGGPAAGLAAVAAAAAAIRRGDTEIALAGGADSLREPEHLIEHYLGGRLWTGEEPRAAACRPFALGRQGYLLGEGAAVVVLESETHARGRGAATYAEIVGAGEAAGPAEEAEETLLAAACEALGGGPAPDALFGQGLGTPADDLAEARAATRLAAELAAPGSPPGRRGAAAREALLLPAAVPEAPGPPPGRQSATATGAPLAAISFTSATGALGYTGAASGALALAHALLALRHGVVPPTAGFDARDPGCPLVPVARARQRALARVLVWAGEEGGKSAALCLESA
jgi:3-oxoacyl-[acyl-carrier-protein] synthase II